MLETYYPELLEDDEDVVIEDSELHKALTNLGLTDLHVVPKDSIRPPSRDEIDIPAIRVDKSFNKFHCICRHLLQENGLVKKQLNTILNHNILLDDHAAGVYELLGDYKRNFFRRFIEWIPVIGSAVGLLAFTVIKENIPCATASGVVLTSSLYIKTCNILLSWKLKKLVKLQSDLHNLIKHNLKIFRRYCKKSIVNESYENRSIGSEKYAIILEIKKILFEIFESASYLYFEKGNEILKILPSALHTKCVLTKVETEKNKEPNGDEYKKLKSWYYTYVLAQSETMFALANAYNGKSEDTFFKIPLTELDQIVNCLYAELTIYHSKLSDILQTYKICEIQSVERVFKGTPSSKWQDIYINLDLTSQRIQLAYKEIFSILEIIDATNNDDNEDDVIKPISEKMTEASKHLENAKNFAEFSNLLIAKTRKKAENLTETENEKENLFSVDKDNRTVVMVDSIPLIEDEVFEEYIREEYLKPLIEDCNSGVIDEFKLDKLLKKNFMSELKEALVDKKKSMTEREHKALTRMYEKMKKDPCFIHTDSDKSNKTISESTLALKPSVPLSAPISETYIPSTQPPPPPPPPPPSTSTLQPEVTLPISKLNLSEPCLTPPVVLSQKPQTIPPPPPPLPPLVYVPPLSPQIIENKIIAETQETEEIFKAVNKIPVPLPRVKMLQSDGQMLYSQKFSIQQHRPNQSVMKYQAVEEFFIGSGENSEEEDTNCGSETEETNSK